MNGIRSTRAARREHRIDVRLELCFGGCQSQTDGEPFCQNCFDFASRFLRFDCLMCFAKNVAECFSICLVAARKASIRDLIFARC